MRNLSRTAVALAATALTTTLTTGLTTGAATAAPTCTPAWKLLDVPAIPDGGYSVAHASSVSSKQVMLTTEGDRTSATLTSDGRSVRLLSQQIPHAAMAPGGAWETTFDSNSSGWARYQFRYGDTYGSGIPVFARLYGGRWTFVPTAPSPDPTVSRPNLQGMDSISPSAAWSVGEYTTQSADSAGAAIQQWDGRVWKNIDNPARTRANATLRAVSARSRDDVWAVGRQFTDPGRIESLILHYDGKAWTELPGAPGVLAELVSVSARASDDVWAVGFERKGDVFGPVALHWDGTSWSSAATPSAAWTMPMTVYAAGPSDVWITAMSPADGSTQPPLQHWDGTSWTDVRPEGVQPPGSVYIYASLTGSGPKDVWATGQILNGSGWESTSQPLVAHLSCEGR
ncbi:hypothetical protein MF672_015935 [Actinomadura sp. ATCC 31491]|uniref:Secreted protein n=1 Tax=Actinomadura luzonensis TaxID=2805427 RepID=A0ABT0FSE7_9ACTN|nr:hypothetical protein [Actinomadura luzonensis]MCK2215267.1 hypothetical protein [Actinomadura luzonensis]